MTSKEIIEIMEKCGEERLKSEDRDCFLEGLKLLSSLDERDYPNYGVGHDGFHGPDLNEVPDINEEQVRQLVQWGWGFSKEFECFVYFM